MSNVQEEISGKYELIDLKALPKKHVASNVVAFIPPGKSIADRIMFHTASGQVDSFVATKVRTVLDPDNSEIDRLNVSSLMKNNNVKLFGMSDSEHKSLVSKGLKKSNPRFMLKSLNHASSKKFDQTKSLIKARFVLYDDNSNLDKQKLIWLCSYFGIPYRNDISDVKKYKENLVNRLDKFIQKSQENIDLFLKTLDEIKSIEVNYYITELMRMGIVSFYNGIYKFEDRPIGATVKDIISFLESSPTLYESMKKKVFEDNKGKAYGQ